MTSRIESPGTPSHGHMNETRCVVLGHPTGNANVRAAVQALESADFLSAFWTSVCWNPRSGVAKILPRVALAELERRTFAHVDSTRIHTWPWREMLRLGAQGLGFQANPYGTGMFSVDAVYRSFDRAVARGLTTNSSARLVYAYECGALAQFSVATRMGLRRVYELPIGYWRAGRRIFEEEGSLQPQWAATLPTQRDSSAGDDRKDEELRLADVIVVASSFTRDTLFAFPGPTPSAVVLPYGAPPVTMPRRRSNRSGKLRALFVGALSQRKGISYLFDAVDKMRGRVELTVIGRLMGDCSAVRRALARHRWVPSLPHGEVLEEMRAHDVLIFPSLFEGFGLVILEAMAQGLPVITTAHTGGPDVIEDGVDGFIVPIRSSSAIVSRLDTLLSDPALLQSMASAAQLKAAGNSWSHYRAGLVSIIRSSLES